MYILALTYFFIWLKFVDNYEYKFVSKLPIYTYLIKSIKWC